jgi:hypothetical protein
VRAIDRAWTDANFDSLSALLHPEVVVVRPGFADRVNGGGP